MTIDTSNKQKLPWRDLPREVKAEMLMLWSDGHELQVPCIAQGYWSTIDRLPFDRDIVRIRPVEKRETVTRCLAGYPGVVAFKYETVNGVPDKSVPPRWVE